MTEKLKKLFEQAEAENLAEKAELEKRIKDLEERIFENFEELRIRVVALEEVINV